MNVDPTGADFKRFLAEDPGGPVVMLNMLQYREGGVSSYREYAEGFKKFLATFGGEVVYVGDLATAMVAPDGWTWDAVLLVRYPTRQAFSQMVRDPDYQKITGLRSAGLDAAVLQPSTAWGS